MFDFWRWLRLPTKRFRRQWWGGCSMGPSLDEEKFGKITRLWTAKVDTAEDQKGLVYAFVKYDGGGTDRYPLECLWHDKENNRYCMS